MRSPSKGDLSTYGAIVAANILLTALCLASPDSRDLAVLWVSWPVALASSIFLFIPDRGG